MGDRVSSGLQPTDEGLFVIRARHAAILSDGGPIRAEHLSLDVGQQPRPLAVGDVAATTDLNVVERETIARVLRDCEGNKSKAARQLGLSRTQLYFRLRKYQLLK